ncbi:MAG: hypothetical protein IPK19_12320 [Chloroflexi bacterium]|nr:hypothetical protein [Chloroflexota bacterium]
MKLHKAGFEHARALIREGKVKTAETDWSEKQPDTDKDNRFIENHGLEAWGQWHIGIRTDEDEDNKGHYAFPVGDLTRVHRSGVIAAKQRAAQNGYDDIAKAADELLELIDKRRDDQ